MIRKCDRNKQEVMQKEADELGRTLFLVSEKKIDRVEGGQNSAHRLEKWIAVCNSYTP
jgi:hypothetical protein